MTSAHETKSKFRGAFGNIAPPRQQLVEGTIQELTNNRLVVLVEGGPVVVTTSVGSTFSTDRTIGVAVKGATVLLSRVGRVYRVLGTVQGF